MKTRIGVSVLVLVAVSAIAVLGAMLYKSNAALAQSEARVTALQADLASHEEQVRHLRTETFSLGHGFEVRTAEATCYYRKVNEAGFNLQRCMEETVYPNIIRLHRLTDRCSVATAASPSRRGRHEEVIESNSR